MSDYYWQTELPNKRNMDYIVQIRYSVHTVEKNDYLAEIKRINLWDRRPKIKHHCYIPGDYLDHVNRFLYRYYMLIRLFEKFQYRRAMHFARFIPKLKRIIVHLDNVIESLIRPSKEVSKEMLENERCINFDEYLVTEFLIGRHNPETINEFRSRCRTNLERINLQSLEWSSYDERVPQYVLGESYCYEVENVPEAELEQVWDVVVGWYKRPLDDEWIGSWVEWVNVDGSTSRPHPGASGIQNNVPVSGEGPQEAEQSGTNEDVPDPDQGPHIAEASGNGVDTESAEYLPVSGEGPKTAGSADHGPQIVDPSGKVADTEKPEDLPVSGEGPQTAGSAGTNDKVPVLDHAPETANPSGDVTDTGKPEEEVQVSGEGSQTAGSDTDTRTVNSNENNGTDSGLREQFVKPNNDIEDETSCRKTQGIPQTQPVSPVVGNKRPREDDDPEVSRKRSVRPAVNTPQTAIGFDIFGTDY